MRSIWRDTAGSCGACRRQPQHSPAWVITTAEAGLRRTGDSPIHLLYAGSSRPPMCVCCTTIRRCSAWGDGKSGSQDWVIYGRMRWMPIALLPRPWKVRDCLSSCSRIIRTVRICSASILGTFMLCGHTHGGQVLVPGMGPRFAPVSDKRFVAGLKAWKGRQIFVTRGVGNLGGVRLNCRPEVTLLDVQG